MSDLYSSGSGSYTTYLTEQQAIDIKSEIREAAINQGIVTCVAGMKLEKSINDVNETIKKAATGIYAGIKENTYAVVSSANMLQKTFQEGFDSVNNTLDLGFAGINDSLGAMNAGISLGFSDLSEKMDHWGTAICAKLDAIHDIVNNPLLTQSRELYRRAYSNANKRFYEEALEEVKQAIEKNKTDYISWGLLGKLYLFGLSDFSNVVNVQEATTAFMNACKYITPDIAESKDAKKMASEFYFYYGYSNYILSNESRLQNNQKAVISYLEEGKKHFTKSYSLSEKMYEAQYYNARCLSLLNKKEEALSALEDLYLKDAIYTFKSLSDKDFENYESDIYERIQQIRDRIYNDITATIDKLNNDYEYVGGEYCNKAKKIIANASKATANMPFVDIIQYYPELKQLEMNIKNLKIPCDVEVFNENFSVLQNAVSYETPSYTFFEKVYNNTIVETSGSVFFDGLVSDREYEDNVDNVVSNEEAVHLIKKIQLGLNTPTDYYTVDNSLVDRNRKYDWKIEGVTKGTNLLGYTILINQYGKVDVKVIQTEFNRNFKTYSLGNDYDKYYKRNVILFAPTEQEEKLLGKIIKPIELNKSHSWKIDDYTNFEFKYVDRQEGNSYETDYIRTYSIKVFQKGIIAKKDLEKYNTEAEAKTKENSKIYEVQKQANDDKRLTNEKVLLDELYDYARYGERRWKKEGDGGIRMYQKLLYKEHDFIKRSFEVAKYRYGNYPSYKDMMCDKEIYGPLFNSKITNTDTIINVEDAYNFLSKIDDSEVKNKLAEIDRIFTLCKKQNKFSTNKKITLSVVGAIVIFLLFRIFI